MKEKIHYTSKLEITPVECSVAAKNSSNFTPRSACSFNMNTRGQSIWSDVESEPDRSNPAWKVLQQGTSKEEITSESVQESEYQLSIWEEIMEEYEAERKLLEELNFEKKPFEFDIPMGEKLTSVQYLQQYIFPVLCPALEDTLFQAKKEECLKIQKCIFNGLDNIAELLWNRNPMHPGRMKRGHKYIFDIPFVRLWLIEHPRPIYPLSWAWTENQAITVLQSYIRRYFVCRETDCSEMRKFWQVFKQEKREEELARELEYYEEVHAVVGDTINELIALAVLKSERAAHGCFCISKPCRCECKCFKWCKCCFCYKQEKNISHQFYSNANFESATNEIILVKTPSNKNKLDEQ